MKVGIPADLERRSLQARLRWWAGLFCLAGGRRLAATLHEAADELDLRGRLTWWGAPPSPSEGTTP